MANREALHRQKAHHYECIRVINMQLNALAPVSHLPPELLSKIFLHTAGRFAALGSPSPRLRDWIRVTHVCKHWRENALQCRALWSRLDVPMDLRTLKEFLVRSKNAPLTMHLSFCSWRLPDFGESEAPPDEHMLALSALHRVRALSVDADWDFDQIDLVLKQLGGRAPLLESLKIIGPSDVSELPKLRSSISRMLSHPETGRLRTLITDFGCFTWRSLSLDSLTCLKVRGDGDPSGSSIKSFLKALAHMPCLEELELECMFVDCLQSSVTLPAPITLPRLRHLRTHRESTCTATIVLNNLYTPSLSQLSVGVSEGGDKEEHILLFTAMAEKASTLGQFMSIALHCSRPGATYIYAYRNVCKRTADPKDDSTSEWLTQHIPTFEYLADGVNDVPLAEFCRLLPVRDAEALLLDYNIPTQDEWLGLTRYMEAVTELRLHFATDDVINLCKLLSLKQEDPRDGRTLFALPNLRAFTIDEASFREDFTVSPDKDRIAKLRAFCTQRAEEGAEIKTLRILRAWELWEEDLGMLREVVPCVESDGMLESASWNSSHDRRPEVVMEDSDEDDDRDG